MLIRIDTKGATVIPPGHYLEKQIEVAVEKAPAAFLGTDVLLIGRQVRTDRGIVDLLGLDRDGNVVIIEVKRYESPREIVSQAISYRSHFRKTVAVEHLSKIAEDYFGKVSGDGVLKAKLIERFGAVPKDFNKKQIVVLVAEHFPDGVLDDLEEVADHICVQFSYFNTEKGEEFFTVKRVSEPDMAHAQTSPKSGAMRDFDPLFANTVNEVKCSLPQSLATFNNTQVHKRKDQWIRFHWRGMDTHVGLWAKQKKGGSEISVYFSNWGSDPRVADLLKQNESTLRRTLGLAKDDVFDSSEKLAIDKSVDEKGAAKAVATFLSTLKPLLGDRL
jgi:hypothetical protein